MSDSINQAHYRARRLAATIVLFLFLGAVAWGEEGVKVHRTQAGTKDESGWYQAASTEGDFTVSVPIPFNDFTVTVHDPKLGDVRTYGVGGKSAEGFEFSAAETPFVERMKHPTPSSMLDSFRQNGKRLEDAETNDFHSMPSCTFTGYENGMVVFARCVLAPHDFVFLQLKFPPAERKHAEQLKEKFLSSLRFRRNPTGVTSQGNESILSHPNGTALGNTGNGGAR